MVLRPTRRGSTAPPRSWCGRPLGPPRPRVCGARSAAPGAEGPRLPAGPGLGGPGGRSPGGGDRILPGPGDGGGWGAPPGGHLWPHRGIARLAGAKGGFRPHRGHPPAGRRAGVRRGGHHRRPRLLPPLWLSHRQGLRHPPARQALSRGPAGKRAAPRRTVGGAPAATARRRYSPSPPAMRACGPSRGAFPPKSGWRALPPSGGLPAPPPASPRRLTGKAPRSHRGAGHFL